MKIIKIPEAIMLLEEYVKSYIPSIESYGAFIAHAWYNCTENDRYLLDEVYREHLVGQRYRSIFSSGDVVFGAEYTVRAWSDHWPVWVTDVVDVEYSPQEIESLLARKELKND